MLFPALASIIKEKIFSDAKEELDGQSLDIFVVNSFGSGAQALGVLLLLPLIVSSRGLSLSELPQYVGDGVSSTCVKCTYVYVADASVHSYCSLYACRASCMGQNAPVCVHVCIAT